MSAPTAAEKIAAHAAAFVMGERVQCQYSAAHVLRGEDAPAVELIECGPLGEVPVCAACAAFYRRQGGEDG